jgi:GNAT superfamily N-acetyltransferase
MAAGEMWVAEMEGRIVGYSALIKRRNIGVIAELFVRPEHQSGDIGAALLHQLLEKDLPILCTMSSSDPRALSLYIRAGLRPQWPHFHLAGGGMRLPDSMAKVDIEAAESAETRIITWDAEICGRLRPEEHAYWQSTHATPVWCRRDGEIVGYGYVHDVRAGGTNPASVILGPIGARSPGDADACVRALLRWSCSRGDVFHIGVPGQHPSLPTLLRLGFRIESVETFCCSCATAFFDPRLYIPSLTLEGTAFL